MAKKISEEPTINKSHGRLVFPFTFPFIFAGMSMLNYIIWNAVPEIVSGYSVRWYGLLFAAGFIVSQQILFYIYRQEGKPEKDIETLTIYIIIATIIGARLGHVLFYEPHIFLEDPLSVFLPATEGQLPYSLPFGFIPGMI